MLQTLGLEVHHGDVSMTQRVIPLQPLGGSLSSLESEGGPEDGRAG
jgi:hypothetical protein